MDLLLALFLLWLLFGAGAGLGIALTARHVQAARSARMRAILRCPKGRAALRSWMTSGAAHAVVRYRTRDGVLTTVALHRAMPPLQAAARARAAERARNGT